jgi:hypothetical protein
MVKIESEEILINNFSAAKDTGIFEEPMKRKTTRQLNYTVTTRNKNSIAYRGNAILKVLLQHNNGEL